MKSRGDTLNYGFKIINKETHEPYNLSEILDVVFQINNDTDLEHSIELIYSNGDLQYDTDSKMFYFTLDQEQTFKLLDYNAYMIRVKFTDEQVVSHKGSLDDLQETLNHRVIEEEENEPLQTD